MEGAPKEVRQKKAPVREPTPPPNDDMDYYEEPAHHQTYREPSPPRQKERGKWKPAKEPQQKPQNIKTNQNGHSDDRNQNGVVDDRSKPRNRGNVNQRKNNTNNNNNNNRPTAQSQKINSNREERGTSNKSHDLRRSNDVSSKLSRDSKQNHHEKEPLTHRSQRNDRQDSNPHPGKPQSVRQSQNNASFHEERDMEVDGGEEEMQHNGYHDEVDNQDNAYANDNGDETEDEYDNETPQQRPARKGPRMETPECWNVEINNIHLRSLSGQGCFLNKPIPFQINE